MSQRRTHLVSRAASDRSTAYAMSNRFVRAAGRLLFAWVAPPGRSCWGSVQAGDATIQHHGTLGEGIDNHCGPALAHDVRGQVHAVLGAHHGTFFHRILSDPAGSGDWGEPAPVAELATHPSLVCDRQGTLHLAWRSSVVNPWTLKCRRLEEGKGWSVPTTIAVAATPWYTSWTNALAIGPDNVLHLVLGAYRLLDDGCACYGAAHLLSDDGGEHWRQLGGAPLQLPVDIAALELIEPAALEPGRLATPTQLASIEESHLRFSLRMTLSNVLADHAGQPWVIVHDTLNMHAALYGAIEGLWRSTNLSPAVDRVLPGWGVCPQSSLSRHADGTLEAVLMAAPLDRPLWGAKETELVRVLLDDHGEIRSSGLVRAADDRVAHWLPSLEHWDWNHPFDRPALLYTSGSNCGGPLPVETFLDLPAPLKFLPTNAHEG